jgi:predicted CopG family antitoxin
MTSIKTIDISAAVWSDLSHLQKPGMSMSDLLEIMVEHEKKWRLVEDIKKIQNEEDLVDIDF